MRLVCVRRPSGRSAFERKLHCIQSDYQFVVCYSQLKGLLTLRSHTHEIYPDYRRLDEQLVDILTLYLFFSPVLQNRAFVLSFQLISSKLRQIPIQSSG